MLHTETANKRGADLNNVSSNSVLARCDVAPSPFPFITDLRSGRLSHIIVSKKISSLSSSTGRKVQTVFWYSLCIYTFAMVKGKKDLPPNLQLLPRIKIEENFSIEEEIFKSLLRVVSIV